MTEFPPFRFEHRYQFIIARFESGVRVNVQDSQAKYELRLQRGQRLFHIGAQMTPLAAIEDQFRNTGSTDTRGIGRSYCLRSSIPSPTRLSAAIGTSPSTVSM